MIVAALLVGAQMPTMALSKPTPSVLVMSKTAGFHHDSIQNGKEALTKMGQAHGLRVEFTEDGASFSPDNLKRFDVVVFLSTTGDILDSKQQNAFENWLEAGGGFVGIHAATDTEYDWPWYGKAIGAWFKAHPAIQPAKIIIEDRGHPSTNFLPPIWDHTDEWYNFRVNPRPNVHVLASIDEKSYKGGEMMGDHPMMWTNEVGRGRVWYTEFGHTAECYTDPQYLKSLYEGILWTAQAMPPRGARAVTWEPQNGWSQGGNASADRRGVALGGGTGVLANLDSKEELISEQNYGSGFYHVEFLIGEHANSGVYLQGRYEVQIYDSFGKPDNKLTYADCGSIYARRNTKGDFDGHPALVNAVHMPGVWNTYDILFQAAKFDAKGKKVADAVMKEVRLNGVVVQKDVELSGQTGGPLKENEVARGPLRIQGDHGKIAIRNVWVRPLN